MENLEYYGVQALDANEIRSIDGGSKGRLLRKIGEWAWHALGIADALDDIREGFNEGNSGECPPC